MRCKLGDISEITKLAGYEFTKYIKYIPDGEIIAVRALNLKNGALVLDDIQRISKEVSETLPRSQLHKNDIVLSYTGTLGECAQIREDGKYHLAPNVCKITPNDSVVNPNFLFQYIRCEKFKQTLINYAHGSTQPTIPMSTIRDIPVDIPDDLEKQGEIAAILSALDEKIEINRAINDNLMQQAVTIFKSWFVEYSPFDGIEPKEWETVNLEKITSLISRGIAPKYSDNSDQIVINQKCIRNHMIDLSQARTHTPKVINEKWLRFGDLLINSTGDGTLGRAAQVWFQPPNITVDSHVTVVRPAKENLIFYIGLWGVLHEREIESLHTGSTGQTELPKERVKALELRLPDNGTLDRFNTLIAPMAAAIVSKQNENNKLATLRDALLPKLMSGEIDVSAVQL